MRELGLWHGKHSMLYDARAQLLRCRLGREHVVDRISEIIDPGHGNDDHIAMPLAFLRDPKKPTAAVFTQVDGENLPLDLQLPRFDDAVHVRQEKCYNFETSNWKQIFSLALTPASSRGVVGWENGCSRRQRRAFLFLGELGVRCDCFPSDAIAKSACCLKISIRATTTCSVSPTASVRFDWRPMRRRRGPSKT